jgi:hypothetical protein
VAAKGLVRGFHALVMLSLVLLQREGFLEFADVGLKLRELVPLRLKVLGVLGLGILKAVGGLDETSDDLVLLQA